VLRHQNLDADRTTLGGESVDLGGFRSLVHGHDLDRRISMFFAFDVPGSLGVPGEAEPGGVCEALDERVENAWVRLEIGWSRTRGEPVVFVYELGVDGRGREPLMRIEAGTSRGQVASLVLRVDDGVFGEADDDGQNAVVHLVEEAGWPVRDGLAGATLHQRSALPDWGRALPLAHPDDEAPSPALSELRAGLSMLAVGLGERLTSELERLVYLGPLRTVPPRGYRPPLTEALARWPEGLAAWDALYKHGPDLLARVNRWMEALGTGYRLELRELREVDKGLTRQLENLVALRSNQPRPFKGGGNMPAPVKVGGNTPPRTAGARRTTRKATTLEDEVARFLDAVQAAPTRRTLVLVDDRTGVALEPSDVGVGISQVLPILVAAVHRGRSGAGRFVLVEQPELHIHPKLQVNLADLFIEQSRAGSLSEHTFLLETHSEHILLRLLRRIREASETVDDDTKGAPEDELGDEEGEAAPSPVPFGPDRLSVVYVQRAADGSTEFVPLRVDENGEFLDLWPEGFFDERMGELFG
jgi:hypothetical protein